MIVTKNKYILYSIKEVCQVRRIVLLDSNLDHSMSDKITETRIEIFKRLLITTNTDEDILRLVLEISTSHDRFEFALTELFLHNNNDNEKLIMM